MAFNPSVQNEINKRKTQRTQGGQAVQTITSGDGEVVGNTGQANQQVKPGLGDAAGAIGTVIKDKVIDPIANSDTVQNFKSSGGLGSIATGVGQTYDAVKNLGETSGFNSFNRLAGSAMKGVVGTAANILGGSGTSDKIPDSPTLTTPTFNSSTPTSNTPEPTSLGKYNTPQFKVSSAQASIDRLNQGIADIKNNPTTLQPLESAGATTQPTQIGAQQQPYKSFQGVAGTDKVRLQPDGTRNATTFGSVDSNGRPTGPNSGSISFADGRTLSSEQQSYLGKIMDRNSDPAFQQRMRDQVKIVDDRREQERLGDIRRGSQDDVAKFNKGLTGMSLFNQAKVLQDKMANDQNNATSIANNQYTNAQKLSSDEATNSLARQKLGMEDNRLSLDANKAMANDRSDKVKNYYSALTSLADKGLDSPAQRYSLASQHFGNKALEHLPDILGDKLSEFQSLSSDSDKRDYLTKLGIIK
jgi:hypothetical protein